MSAGAFHPSRITRQPPVESKPPAVPEPQIIDGRLCWPRVVEYETDDGARTLTPPRGVGYRAIVHNVAIYDALNQIGALRDPAHTGLQTGEYDD